MSSSHTTSADITEHSILQVSVDEIASSHLINALKVIGPALGICIQSKLSQAYGEEKWRQKAGYGLSKGMYSRLGDTRRHPLKDIFLICELILFNVEVLSVDMMDIDGVRDKAVLLERIVADVDLVSRTRTFLFHGQFVSVSEVVRCLARLERLCHRLPQLVLNRKKWEEFQQYVQAGGFLIFQKIEGLF